MNVRKVADLARIRLTDEEAARYQSQMEQILAYVEKIGELDLEGIEPTSHAVPVQDVMRPDEDEGPGLTREEALGNAPETAREQFKMPKVVE